jgi:AcrR family transcriptional regulator
VARCAASTVRENVAASATRRRVVVRGVRVGVEMGFTVYSFLYRQNRLVCLLRLRIDRPVCYCQGMPTATPTADHPSARQRLLDAAMELFYAEGIHTVGIDRVIERAGVAKATLYSTFGSKEALVAAYLDEFHARWRERVTRELDARGGTAQDKLLDFFDIVGDRIAEPGFHGCAFINATAESAPGPIFDASDRARDWRRELLHDLAADAGVRDPDVLAEQFMLLYDGVQLGARLDRDPTVAAKARTAAAVLLDAQLTA